MFRAILTQPLFNLMVLIFAFIPGHDFGITIIITTLLIRLLLWPLLKKQLHQQRAMKSLQPDIAKIKKRVKGDKQKEAELMMELYKERGVNPLGSIGVMIIQIPILIALYAVLRAIIGGESFDDLTYGFVKSIPYVADIVKNPSQFHPAFLGIIDLSETIRHSQGGVYWLGVPIVVLAAVGQFLQSKTLMASQGSSKSLRDVLRDAKDGKKTDSAEQAAAMSGGMIYLFPLITLFIGSTLPIALSLYWAASSIIATIQQRMILQQDVSEMANSDVTVRTISTGGATKAKTTPRKKKSATTKTRKGNKS